MQEPKKEADYELALSPSDWPAVGACRRSMCGLQNWDEIRCTESPVCPCPLIVFCERGCKKLFEGDGLDRHWESYTIA